MGGGNQTQVPYTVRQALLQRFCLLCHVIGEEQAQCAVQKSGCKTCLCAHEGPECRGTWRCSLASLRTGGGRMEDREGHPEQHGLDVQGL